MNLCPPQEQLVLLTTEPSLQAFCSCVWATLVSVSHQNLGDVDFWSASFALE